MADGDENFLEQGQCLLHNILMTFGEGREGTGENSDSRHSLISYDGKIVIIQELDQP